MYTQCPDCGIAFGVTVDVLKQAVGKVRCGGCGNAFNALENLSEKKPAKAVDADTNAALPELTPEFEHSDDGTPQSISPEQSTALLKTLEELAGSDIRIEDTGVEWLVLDEDAAAEPAAGDDAAEIFDHPGESNVDELLVESATPVDEILSATIVKTSVEELRFDDNTPLPEDFGEDSETPGATVPANDADSGAQTIDFDDEDDSEVEDQASQSGVALGEADEWEDILGEFDDENEEGSAPVQDSEEGDTAVHGAEAEDSDEEDETVSQDEDEDEDHELALQSEEEKSMNEAIDQELLSLASEDEDGHASTIVTTEEDVEDSAIEEQPIAAEDDDEDDEEDEPDFENIVMEGDVVRSTLGDLKREADAANAASLAGKGGRTTNDLDKANSGTMSYGMIAGLVALTLLLVIQAMHQSREALATYPAFNGTIGPIYRVLGRPLQPAWDITGWRFEATKGSTDANDSELTIYSRIGNKSDKPLPYPLIGISLTDRFEETIGSRVLDPAEYLATDLDPRKLVRPGNTFNAVISIPSPSGDATGFKLNVCYRLSGGLLRCAIEDFK